MLRRGKSTNYPGALTHALPGPTEAGS